MQKFYYKRNYKTKTNQKLLILVFFHNSSFKVKIWHGGETHTFKTNNFKICRKYVEVQNP